MAQQYQQAPLMSVQDYDGHSQGHLEVEHKGHVHGEVEWQSGLCGCCSPFSTCCMGFWCPCILHGRTHHRIEKSPDGSLEGYSCCNLTCCAYACLTFLSPFNAIMGIFQRRSIRQKYGLKGGSCGDCLRHCFCTCCSIIQEEKETVARAKLMKPTGYQQNAQMAYK